MNKYGYEFTAEKTLDGWKVSSVKHYLKVSIGKTKKEALSNAMKILENKGKAETDQAFINGRKKTVKNRLFDYLKPYFKTVFGFECPPCKLSMILNGKSIDVVKFDKLAGTPDGISTYDFIAKKYGNKAVKLLKKLI